MKTFFEKLREVNVERCVRFGHGSVKSGWNDAEWGNAIAGETGELCNILKKRIRRLISDPPMSILQLDAADEMADIIVYLDLLAARLNIDLERAIVSKFNATSVKHGYPERL